MSTSSQFQIATRTALEPWSTADQKLGALAYMESLATPEALGVLKQAIELVGLYVSQKDRNNPTLPKAGEVAAAAALSVGRLEHLGGITELLKIILSPEETQTLRECAAFGLGGLTSKEAFLAFEKAFQVENKVVFEMLLKSLTQSYARLEGLSTPYSEDLLVFLFESLVEKRSMGVPDEYEPTIISLIAKNVDRKQELELRDLVKSNTFDASMYLAIMIMLERESTLSEEALVAVLEKSGGDPEIYSKIGEKFEGTSNTKIIEAARKAIVSYSNIKRFKSIFSKSARVSRQAQFKAASRIIQKVPIYSRTAENVPIEL